MEYKRIYVSKEYARALKQAAIEEDKTVVDLTKDLAKRRDYARFKFKLL